MNLLYPCKVATDEEQRILVISDTGNHRILVAAVSEYGTYAEIRDSYGTGTAGNSDGPCPEAQFHAPAGVAFGRNHHSGRLFVADTENNLIRSIDLSKKKVTTLAGTGQKAPRAKMTDPVWPPAGLNQAACRQMVIGSM